MIFIPIPMRRNSKRLGRRIIQEQIVMIGHYHWGKQMERFSEESGRIEGYQGRMWKNKTVLITSFKGATCADCWQTMMKIYQGAVNWWTWISSRLILIAAAGKTSTTTTARLIIIEKLWNNNKQTTTIRTRNNKGWSTISNHHIVENCPQNQWKTITNLQEDQSLQPTNIWLIVTWTDVAGIDRKQSQS